MIKMIWFLILILTNGLCYGQDKNTRTYMWSFFSNRENVPSLNILQKSENDLLPIPYFKYYSIPKQIFDKLIVSVDSIEKKNIMFDQMQRNDAKPTNEPHGLYYEGKLLLYRHRDTIHTYFKDYIAFRFYLSKDSSFSEHDCYSLSYINGIGIFLVENQGDFLSYIETGYDYYALLRIRDQNGKEVVSRKLLKSLTNAILKKEGWL